MAFATIGDLLAPTLDETLPLCEPVQRRALETALLLRGARGAAARSARPRCLRSSLPCARSLRSGRCSSRSTTCSGSTRARPRCLSVHAAAAGRRSRSPFSRPSAGGPCRRRSSSTAPSRRSERLPLEPLSVGAIHRLLSGRLSLNLPRPDSRARARRPRAAIRSSRSSSDAHWSTGTIRATAADVISSREPARASLRDRLDRVAGARPRDARRRCRARGSLGADARTAFGRCRRRHRARAESRCARARRRPGPLHASAPGARLLLERCRSTGDVASIVVSPSSTSISRSVPAISRSRRSAPTRRSQPPSTTAAAHARARGAALGRGGARGACGHG